MTRFSLVVALLTTTLLTTARGQDDLPPETKAIISKLKDEAKNKTPATRASAYKSMGELGASGASLRRTLCDGMLDPAVSVRTAAADALKKVDEPLYKDAMAIYIDKDLTRVRSVAANGARSEPLVPLILPLVAQHTAAASQPILPTTNPTQEGAIRRGRSVVGDCMRTLVAIAPDDELVNKGVLSMLVNAQPENRAVAVGLVGRVKNRKLGLPALMAMAGSTREKEATRVAALGLLPDVSDENTRAGARKVAESVRLDSNRNIREAAEAALRRFDGQ